MLVEVQPDSAAPMRLRLRGPTTLGGSRADGVTVPGLPPGALRLEPRAAGVVLSPATPGLRVGVRPVSPGSRRLVRPGERASFLRLVLAIPSPGPAEHTRSGAAALLQAAARDPDAPPGPHLVVLTGPQAGQRMALGAGLVVGRGRGAALRLADASASRRHARFQAGADGPTVEDLGAKNRVRVNGVPVERRPQPLRPGDVITIGDTEIAYDGPRPRSTPRRRAAPRAHRTRWARRLPGAGARPLVAAALLAFSAAALAAFASFG